MFITEKMHKVSLFLPREDITRFWNAVGRFGELQPTELRRVSQLEQYLSFVDLSELSAKLREAASFLNIDLTAPLDDPTITPLSPDELEKKLEEIYPELTDARARLQGLREAQRSLERELDKLAVQEAHLKLLEPLEVDIGALLRLRRFCVLAGTLPEDHLDQLDRSLQRFPHVLLPYRSEKHRLQLIVVCLNEDRNTVEDILESALFRPLELPEELTGEPKQALKALSAKKENLLEQKRRLEDESSKFEAWRAEQRARLGDFIKINAAVLTAHEQTGQTHAVAVATGWVPKRELHRLQTLVSREPKWVLETEEIPYENAKDKDGMTVPSRMRNPAFFQPFEGLVRLYGVPRYGGFDPTVLFSLSFILMFGMMFGDLGHGFILFLSGLALRGWPGLRASWRQTGTILLAVGTSSMAFGSLYGSFFGYDNIIPALWFHPIDQINRLLSYAIILGIGIIVLGIIINIGTKFIQRRYVELVFERFGALGLWFYLGALLAVYLNTRGVSIAMWLILVMMFLPLLLMPLERPLKRFAARHKPHDKQAEEGGGALVTSLITGVDIFETMIVYLSNTVSFVRVAAFALNHVALSLAIFQIGAMLRGLPAGNVLYTLTVAGGNLLILILEGGVVAIQALRLEFYEFFSKFFEAEGSAFTPFKLQFKKEARNA